MGSIIVNSQNKAYTIDGYALESPMTLVRYWDGSDNSSSNKWYDRIGNQYWTLTSSTHGDGYYEFLNSSATSAKSYALLSGNLPDLHYHWKVVADIAVKYSSTNGQIAIDFGSVQDTGTETCAFEIGLGASGKWGFNSKFNGNSSASTYAPNATNLQETGLSNGDWVRRTVTFGVRASSISGKDETFAIVDGLGIGVSSPYSPIRFNRWVASSYLSRSAINPASNYPYASSARVYSIKVYYEE